MVSDENLNYPGLEDKVSKNISYSHNVKFRGELENKKLKIDRNLTLLDNKTEVKAVSFLKKIVSQRKNEKNPPDSFFCYLPDNNDRTAYDSLDRVTSFLTAVRIFTGRNADFTYDFPIKNSRKEEYYRPFDLRSPKYHHYENIKSSFIESKKDFNIIKKLHSKLIESGFEKPIHYTKIYNAVKFFNHAYDEQWTFLKTTLLFTSLESLFSDSSRTEITEKIAVRTAYLLHPKNSIKRKETYIFIKRGYEIRSLFVHGSDAHSGVRRIMKKFEKDKKVDNYFFHDKFINELNDIVSGCLKNILLDSRMFTFFSREKYKNQQEQEFYTNLVL